jgi:hypothetical protein
VAPYAALIATVSFLAFLTTILATTGKHSSSAPVEVSWKNYSVGVLTDSSYNTSGLEVRDAVQLILEVSSTSASYREVAVQSGTFSMVNSLDVSTYESFFVARILANSNSPPYSSLQVLLLLEITDSRLLELCELSISNLEHL